MHNLVIAVLPSIAFMSYILKFDKYNKEPSSLCIRLFIYGCFTVIPASFLENYFQAFSYQNLWELFEYVFLFIAFIEEGVKFVTTYFLAYKQHEFDEIYDGIIYCVLVSLGFATIENILYVISYGESTGLIRAITAVPAHVTFAIHMGYFMGLSKAKPTKKVVFQLLSILFPTLLHAIYDYLILSNLTIGIIIFVIYILVIYRQAYIIIQKNYNKKPFK